jgi:hypothetical protein
MMERGPNDHVGPVAQLDDGLGMTPEERGRSEGEDRGYNNGWNDGFDEAIRRRSLSLEAIAKTCHEVNRVYCASIGDSSQVPWDQAPEWQRTSALKGVNAALFGVTDEELHALWCDEKRQEWLGVRRE